jgi:hypothetical protein
MAFGTMINCWYHFNTGDGSSRQTLGYHTRWSALNEPQPKNLVEAESKITSIDKSFLECYTAIDLPGSLLFNHSWMVH